MVKVPATPEGLPAIETLIGDGISINITLLFSQDGLSARSPRPISPGWKNTSPAAATPRMSRAWRASSSAASTPSVDKQLDEKIAQANDPSEKERLAALKGKVAIANAKIAYQDYKRLFSGPRWEKLAAKGAKPQRLLWASTGTKNKDYSDVLYVEELIGPDTVNTVPPATLDAFRDHGKLRDSLEENVEDAAPRAGRAGALRRLARCHHRGARQGRRQAVRRCRRQALWRGRPQARDRARAPRSTARSFRSATASARPWPRAPRNGARRPRSAGCGSSDKSVWTGDDEDKWLGWLDSAAKADVADYEDYAQPREGPEILRRRRARHGRIEPRAGGAGGDVRQEGRLPEAARARFHRSGAGAGDGEARIDIAKTVFIVSSKSGGTTEPNAMKDYFYERVAKALGPKAKAGHRFIAVTDPGSSLEKAAKKQGFARIFHGEPTIGGRYSVLSPFGLVPAAAAGIDVADAGQACALDGALLRRRTCRRMRTPACSSASPWASPASKAATR